ncbi:hypothetical protein CAPTEDRAFT_196530 [Capitella teleta]|uniref:Uncharacterized protein n=1 Tax=Capitella teleta TaxID=283909 RepID=R7TY06_CAPTE|nr:hypothetical protein CAPTEDRAFT_196530 [Capitella teleta]|eukprot:ELT98639.1 hypothetical protein CAPTEDRAFT_196530 [Capitella teleta]
MPSLESDLIQVVHSMRLEITALSNQCSELKAQNETQVKTIENQTTPNLALIHLLHQPSPEEKVKNDVIIAKVQKNNDDVTMVTSLYDKIGFSTKPVDVKRIEQDEFKRNNDLVYKMNQKAKEEDAGRVSYSLRGTGYIWKFAVDDQGRWKRDQEWTAPPHAGNEKGISTSGISTSDEETPKGDFSRLYLNARSIASVNRNRNKIAELRNLVSSYEPEILAVCETWLSTNIDDNQIIPACS